MEYLSTSYIIGIVIFLVLITVSIAGFRNRVVLIRGITRHLCTGDTCPLSLDLLILNPLGVRSIAPRGFYAYSIMKFVRDDGSVIHFFRGYVPSLSNTWRIMDPLPSIRLFNIVVSGDGIHVIDILIPYPSFVELPGGSLSPFDTRTGEPMGTVNFLSIRRALAAELGERLVQSMSLVEIVKRVLVDLTFYDGVTPTRYTIPLPRLLALAGIQVNGEIRVIEGSLSTNFRRAIKCPLMLNSASCFMTNLRAMWAWATVIEALLGLFYAFTSMLLPLIITPIIYLALLSVISRLT